MEDISDSLEVVLVGVSLLEGASVAEGIWRDVSASLVSVLVEVVCLEISGSLEGVSESNTCLLEDVLVEGGSLGAASVKTEVFEGIWVEIGCFEGAAWRWTSLMMPDWCSEMSTISQLLISYSAVFL